jgi:hypothetical protein
VGPGFRAMVSRSLVDELVPLVVTQGGAVHRVYEAFYWVHTVRVQYHHGRLFPREYVIARVQYGTRTV